MKKTQKKYSILKYGSALFMMLALFWLTISAPFVYSCMQNIAKQDKATDSYSFANDNDEETANPFGNTTEEKASGGINSLSEEYLHDHHISEHFFSITSQYHKSEDADTYIAFHGELLVPPPNINILA